ncbi:ligand-binding sensor domain-containing protein [Thermoflexibacter ruber]|uniref:Ligand-binding sensor domain-containing protein n=1 Tax=Thermoflexibacter ruber TaxID=1003 RepID=A0A1I2AFZ6_9BACT|nr:sensor histidine kinase [Thermoflexibacter ruber]SFE41913.1 ligand-binding sensor domain-containing protein [Thermoflexibacter ruber]
MRFLYTSFAFILSLSTFAQSPTVKFNHFTTDNGLVSNEIKSLFTDSEGFIWIGTRNGLSRFDGKNFKNYKHNPEDSLSISNNYIWHIHETADGLLWFGTKNGLTVLNKKTNQFKTYYHQKNNSNSLIDNDIREILEDENGIIWLGTKDGLTAFDRKKAQFTNYKTPNPQDASKPNSIWAMCLDKNKTLWIGTAQGLFIFDREKGDFLLQPYRYRGKDNAFIELYEDKEGNLWASSNGGGVYLIPPSREREKVRIFHADSTDNQGFKGRATNKIRQDKHGLIWFLNAEEGVSVYNPQNKRFTNYEKDARNPYSLSNNSTGGFCEDRSGNIWIGTYQSGLNYSDNRQKGKASFQLFQHSPFIPNQLPNQAIAAIFEDSEGLLWIGTYGKGISVYNGNSQTYTNYTKENTQGVLCTNLIAGFAEDSKGNIWVATAHCVRYFDKKREKFVSEVNSLIPQIESEFFEGTLASIYEDKEGVFYFGGNAGLFRWQNNSFKKWKVFKDLKEQEQKLDKNSPIIEDSNGLLWIGKGAINRGIFSFDKKTEKFTHYLLEPDKTNGLADENIYNLAFDSQGTLWVATSEGLYFKEKNQTKFSSISEKDGLPTSMIYSIVIDKKDRLWLATSAGICKVSIRKNKNIRINCYDVLDGAVGADQTHVRNAHFVDKNGYIYFGGSKGFCKFHPDSVQENNLAPAIFFTSFKLFEQEYRLDTAIMYKKHITLTHEQNFLSFDFAALNFIRPDKNQYAYKIDGLNKNWIPLGNKSTVSIAGLKPNTYTLKVKASNNDGIWNEEGTSISITILPPWWATWWFISLIIITISGTIYGIYQYRIKEIRKEEAYKKEKEKMKEAYSVLQNDFQEVNQRLHSARIDTHFLANCMIMINNYINKGDAQEATEAMNDLNRLYRLLLYHSGKKIISLKEECDFLEVYVRMNQRRFDNSFDYDVINKENIDLESVEIPPLLLQPFVENSILHGLRNINKRGKLALEIFSRNELLHILVEDNGIGRQKAGELNGKFHHKRQSVGLALTEKRIRDLFDNELVSPLEITDLVDEQGKPAGTRVVLKIPY